jgi:hypothetical protein
MSDAANVITDGECLMICVSTSQSLGSWLQSRENLSIHSIMSHGVGGWKYPKRIILLTFHFSHDGEAKRKRFFGST